MFKVGISGDLLNSTNEPCFGIEPLNLLKDREDIEISWMDKSIIELDSEITSNFDAIIGFLVSISKPQSLLFLKF